MPTSDKTGACCTGLIGATVLSEVRTISGFTLAPQSRVLGTAALIFAHNLIFINVFASLQSIV
jgi:hypothetical protein